MARIPSIHRDYRPLVTVSLPLAPLTASPVPHLTSLYPNVERGPYGRSSYPGNCSGNFIKDLLLYFRPRVVLDPMTGGGTCRDVCRELGIRSVSFDLKGGQDACDPASYRELPRCDFV